jgi:5-methylcytosine-specific restriction endonuclease McrA
MARSTDEWIGKTDNSKAPPRVCQRVFDRANGICHFCGQPIQPGQKAETDHIKALINGGENRESNLAPIHKTTCHKVKTGADVAEKAKVAAVRQKHIGVAAKKRPIPSPPKAERPDPKTHASPRRSLYAAIPAPLARS